MRGDEEETEEMMNDGASGRSEEVKDEETARGDGDNSDSVRPRPLPQPRGTNLNVMMGEWSPGPVSAAPSKIPCQTTTPNLL